jgi:hypothetical protein
MAPFRVQSGLRRSAVLAVPLLMAAAVPVGAQDAPSREPLEARMSAFLHAILEEPRERVASFFPTRGAWTLVQTFRDRPETPPGEWRIPAAETLRAISVGGPLCWSFEPTIGDVGPFEGAMVMRAMAHPRGWRRVGDRRYVPPGEPAGSPAFVEWRREEGAWVVATVGEEEMYLPPELPTRPRNEAKRDRPGQPRPAVPDEQRFAADAGWYLRHEPILFERLYHYKNGAPRQIGDDELERFASLGDVGIYAEAGTGGGPGVLYVPVRPGYYQPYYGFGAFPCH